MAALPLLMIFILITSYHLTNNKMLNIKNISLVLIILFCCSAIVSGQDEQTGLIFMRSEVHENKVMIRWASSDAKTWQLLNKYGVRLERLTIVRDGKLLDEPEKIILNDCMKPEETEEFMKIAEQYSFGAIIAQAVFGESFEVFGMGEQDITTIIALSEELQQRYAFSLYAADLCFPAALAAGWGWIDETVKENERYLYNVIPLVPEKEMTIETGALFVDAARIDHFPKPLDFYGQFMDESVMLSWNYRTMEALYNAYIPERSEDGINFSPITDTPITQMDTGTGDQIMYADSIKNNITYYYRLAGITPFGSISAYSDTISGMGLQELQISPFITRAIPDEFGGVMIEWEFDQSEENLIESFTLERSDDNKVYSDYITPIDRTLRNITVPNIPATNYFVITANSLTGKKVRSFSVLVQPVDSLPPAVPEGLKAIYETDGAIRLSWQANSDKGSFGYRIFRGQTKEEEMIPLNDIAIRDTVFIDSIDVRMLNTRVYYSITALDERYNQSDRSPVIEVIKPEIIPPTPPFISEIKIENGKNIITWVSGMEDNLAAYELNRKTADSEQFILLATLNGAGNRTYEDSDVENNKTYIYNVKSKSEGGLLSDPSPDYRVTAISRLNVRTQIAFDAVPQREMIKLNWNVSATEVESIQLYKKTGDGTFALFSDGLAVTGDIEDTDVRPGTKYEYMLVVRISGASPQTVIKPAAI